MLCKLPICILIAGTSGHLQISDGQRVPGVAFTLSPPMEFAGVRKRGQAILDAFGKSQAMSTQCLFGQYVEIHALYATGRPCEAALDHLVLQAEGLENLRSL